MCNELVMLKIFLANSRGKQDIENMFLRFATKICKKNNSLFNKFERSHNFFHYT